MRHVRRRANEEGGARRAVQLVGAVPSRRTDRYAAAGGGPADIHGMAISGDVYKGRWRGRDRPPRCTAPGKREYVCMYIENACKTMMWSAVEKRAEIRRRTVISVSEHPQRRPRSGHARVELPARPARPDTCVCVCLRVPHACPRRAAPLWRRDVPGTQQARVFPYLPRLDADPTAHTGVVVVCHDLTNNRSCSRSAHVGSTVAHRKRPRAVDDAGTLIQSRHRGPVAIGNDSSDPTPPMNHRRSRNSSRPDAASASASARLYVRPSTRANQWPMAVASVPPPEGSAHLCRRSHRAILV